MVRLVALAGAEEGVTWEAGTTFYLLSFSLRNFPPQGLRQCLLSLMLAALFLDSPHDSQGSVF